MYVCNTFMIKIVIIIFGNNCIRRRNFYVIFENLYLRGGLINIHSFIWFPLGLLDRHYFLHFHYMVCFKLLIKWHFT